VISNATQIIVSAGPPADIVVGAEFCNVAALNVVNEEVEIVAIVSDIYNNAVNNNTAVYFTTDEGVIKSHEDRTSHLDGRVQTIWMSAPELTDNGRVWVYAETAGGTVRDSVMFYNTWTTNTINVLSAPSSLEASGVSGYVYLEALDRNSNPVISGTDVTGEGSFVDAANGQFEDGCGVAVSRLKVTSRALSRDYSMDGVADDGIGAVDNVFYYTNNGASVTVPIPLSTGPAYSKSCELDGETNLAASQQATFWVFIRDRFNNPLGDHVLNVSAVGGGTITGATPRTNSYGEATFTFTAPAAADTVTIQVVDTDPRGQITLSETVIIK